MRSGIVIALLFVALHATAAEVRLRSSAVCSTSVVRLGDVAEVAGDSNIAGALADVTLCPAPAPGQQRTLTQEEIRRLLTFSGLERKDCIVTGSEAVTISGAPTTAQSGRARQPLFASGVRQAIFEGEAGQADRAKPIKPAASEVATPAEASKATLVERGATVAVAARTAGVRITTSGKALEAGKAGDSINVELADTKQRILATVVGVQSVEVSR